MITPESPGPLTRRALSRDRALEQPSERLIAISPAAPRRGPLQLASSLHMMMTSQRREPNHADAITARALTNAGLSTPRRAGMIITFSNVLPPCMQRELFAN